MSEARAPRAKSSRDLLVLCAAAGLGAVSMIVLSPALSGPARPGAELTLATGAFLVGYLRRFGVLGTGIGSQIFIGQLLAYGAKLVDADLRSVGLAALVWGQILRPGRAAGARNRLAADGGTIAR